MKVKVLMLVLGIFGACMSTASAAVVVAFAQDTMKNDFRRAQVFEVRDELAKYPEYSFVYSDAKGQTSLMIHQIEQFIRDKVDVLVLGTADAKAVVPVVRKAYQSGIKVIVLDRGIEGEDYTTFINSDNVLIGRLGAEYIVDKLQGKGTVLLFEGLQTADVTHLRTEGFLSVVSQYPEISVIKRTGNYLRKDAVVEMEKLLEEGYQPDAIFSESDSMLSGVRLVLEKRGIDPAGLIMVGCDYTREAQQAISKGSQTASVLFPLGGRQAVELIKRLMAGEEVDKHIYIPVKLVTQENFHQVDPIF